MRNFADGRRSMGQGWGYAVEYPGFWLGGTLWGSGAEAHEGPRIFENFQKNFLRKLLKCIILAYFSKKFNKPCVNFSRVWTKNTNR